jgi:predicted outer membrane protein
MVSRTIFITASACAGSADETAEPLLASAEEESGDEVFDVHAARRARTHVNRRIRRVGGIPELGRSVRPRE